MIWVANEDYHAVLHHVRRPTFNFLRTYLPPLPPQSPCRSDGRAAAEILYKDLLDNGLRFIRIILWRSRGLCREAPGNECGEELGATMCILGGEGIKLEVLEGQ
jgi:hypothetical protein